MKLIGIFLFAPVLVLAQVQPRPSMPAPSQISNFPPGTVIWVPPDVSGNSQAKKPLPFPKDWFANKPDGVPYAGPLIIAGVKGEKQVEGFPIKIKTDEDEALVKAQTLAIQSLKTGIEKLEARIKELEKLEARIKELEKKNGGGK